MRQEWIVIAIGCVMACGDDDGAGARTREVRRADTTCDGTPEPGCDVSTFNAAGHLIDFGTDNGCDGTLDENCNSAVLDGKGNVIRAEDDNDCDGMPERCTAGARGSESNTWVQGDDADCDGVPDGRCIEATFDSYDRATHLLFDLACNGSRDGCVSVTYADDRLSSMTQEDSGCDGIVELCSVSTYDASGNVIESGTDDDCDEDADSSCITASYDNQQRLLDVSVDDDCDGTPDSNCSHYEYGPNDAPSRTLDLDCDGTPDACWSAERTPL